MTRVLPACPLSQTTAIDAIDSEESSSKLPPCGIDITELLIRLAMACNENRELNHTLAKLYSGRQFSEQVSSASHPRNAAIAMIILGVLSASASTFGAVMGANTHASNIVGSALYNKAPGVASKIFGQSFDAASFSNISSKGVQSIADLLSGATKITDQTTQSLKATKDAESGRTQQFYQMSAEDERNSREGYQRALNDASKLLELEAQSARAILGR